MSAKKVWPYFVNLDSFFNYKPSKEFEDRVKDLHGSNIISSKESTVGLIDSLFIDMFNKVGDKERITSLICLLYCTLLERENLVRYFKYNRLKESKKLNPEVMDAFNVWVLTRDNLEQYMNLYLSQRNDHVEAGVDKRPFLPNFGKYINPCTIIPGTVFQGEVINISGGEVDPLFSEKDDVYISPANEVGFFSIKKNRIHPMSAIKNSTLSFVRDFKQVSFIPEVYFPTRDSFNGKILISSLNEGDYFIPLTKDGFCKSIYRKIASSFYIDFSDYTVFDTMLWSKECIKVESFNYRTEEINYGV